MVRIFACLCICLAAFGVTMPAHASHDPQVTGCSAEDEVCKPACNNDTEITSSLCIGQKPGNWVCCKPSTNLAPGQGGCPTYGDKCIEDSPNCPAGTVKQADTCLQGNGICCRPDPTYATPTTPTANLPKPIKLTDPLGGIGVLGIVNRFVNMFLGILGALALLVFIYAGFVWMTAGGSGERVKHAVDTMKYAMIGLGLIIFSYAIILTYLRAITGG